MNEQMSLFDFGGFDFGGFEGFDEGSDTEDNPKDPFTEGSAVPAGSVSEDAAEVLPEDKTDAGEESCETEEEVPEDDVSEDEEGEVEAEEQNDGRKPAGPVAPRLSAAELAEKKVEEAEKELGDEKLRIEELNQLTDAELAARTAVYLESQMKIWETSKNPTVFSIIKLIVPHLRERAERDRAFARSLLKPGKAFSGMYMHVYEFFRTKAKEEQDRLTDAEKKAAGNALCYASGDDAELYAPADEYFMTSDAEKKLEDARKELETLAKKQKKTGAPKSREEKPKAKKKKKETEDMLSLFEENF